ncbi:hypothetical protein, partial [Defluviitalea phaphyphila]|uniref:hypothetical protein n=1 Tax=Defluviitalea phaphyphila TaxID=1473580 RepID=UPI00118750C2
MKKMGFLFIIIILCITVINLKNMSYGKNYNEYSSENRGKEFDTIEKGENHYIIFPVTSTKASSETGLRWETEAYKITMFPKGTQINIDGEDDHINCPIENMKDQIVIDQS